MDSNGQLPSVSIVFLVYNRCDELRESLRRMLAESDYDASRVDVIVVDNASTDGSAAMVREEYPQVRLVERERNCGVSGWNDGFAAATGDFVLALDDDCYLPPEGLRHAVMEAQRRAADLVSFTVVSTHEPDYRFTQEWRSGLFAFWGCAVLIRRRALDALGGYDPEIFVWANELEFMLRFFDRGFRHLHLPEVVAQHMKPVDVWENQIPERQYRLNARHFAYIAAKLLRPRDAAGALVALLAHDLRNAVRIDPVALKGMPDTIRGFVHGLRHRRPVRPEVSHAYRRNFHVYASPWWTSRPPLELLRSIPAELAARKTRYTERPHVEGGRYREFYAERARFYPDEAAVLEL